jgi:hypothetical protein
VRVEAVPTRADFDLSGWQIEIVAADAAAPDLAVRRVPLVPAANWRGAMTAVVDGLAVGKHAVRIVPPAHQASPPAEALPAAEIVVTEPMIERPGGRADIGALVTAARDSAGAVVSIDEIGSLTNVLAAIVPDSAAAAVAGGETGGRQRLPLRAAAAHAAMLLAVAALAAAWWPTPRARGGVPA